MKLAVLFSGGKDSNYALYLASKKHEIACLICMKSENADSYMFQSEGVDKIDIQAKALKIPLLEFKTKGKKEKEVGDLQNAIKLAQIKYGIEGVVTGAIGSVYQATRVQKVCNNLDLWCFNPLWQKEELSLLQELSQNKFDIIIVGIASYPLDKSFLGKTLDKNLIEKLQQLQKKYKINPAGEGGEIETFVLDSPLFTKKINIIESQKYMLGQNSGFLKIIKTRFENKK